MSIDLAVVPVAGLGTRLLPATKSQPKEMLPVGRKPVVQYVVEELNRVGMNKVLFITGPGKTSIENHFDINQELTKTLRETGKEELLVELEFERTVTQYFFTRQRQLMGLGHAVLCAEPVVVDKPFAVALGDSIIGLNSKSDILKRMIKVFEEQKASAVVAFEKVNREEVHLYGIASPKEEGAVFEVSDLIEKPNAQEAPSTLAIAARYVFGPEIFQALKKTKHGKNDEIQLTDAIRLLIKESKSVYGVCLNENENRYDIGNFQAYFRAFTKFALEDENHGPELRVYLEELLNEYHS